MRKTKEVTELIRRIRNARPGEASIDLAELRPYLCWMLADLRSDMLDMAAAANAVADGDRGRNGTSEYTAWLDGVALGAGMASTLCDLLSVEAMANGRVRWDCKYLGKMFAACGWRKKDSVWHRLVRRKRKFPWR